MPEELEKLLKENIEVSRESLKILKGIRRNNRIATAFKIFYWAIIIGGLIGAFYYLQPYIQNIVSLLQQLLNMFSGVQKTGDSLKTGQSISNLSPDFLKNLSPDLLKKLQNALNIK